MDALQFDNYTSYSDASTPRTPSPRTDDLQPRFASPANYKPLDYPMSRTIFEQHPDDTVVPETHAIDAPHIWSAPHYPTSFPPPPGSRGSLLEELYDHDIPEQNVPQDVYLDHHQHHSHHNHHHPEAGYHNGNWSSIPQTAHGDHVPLPMRHPHDIAMTRRATFPYVRHDRDSAAIPYPPPSFMVGSDHDSLTGSPYGSRPGTVYGEPLSMDGSPHLSMSRDALHHMDEPFAHSVSISSPHHHPQMYEHHLDGIKTEEQAPIIVPTQAYCRPPSAGMHALPCLSPHAGLLVQHTDDAASKETQYLRRRCFNCHTTEPPSWRRSTLNPGKIVCNKCGLYERTHLRPRPLRFDELRAGSKTRKQPKAGGSPKGNKSQMVKKEPRDGEEPLVQQQQQPTRRSSVSSNNGSVHSGSGASDWDDNVSIYSSASGSAPPSSYNSPSMIARDTESQSPPLPRDGGIRLPNAPLSDIASLQSQTQSPPQHAAALVTPRKAATAPAPYYPGQEYYARRGSLPVSLDAGHAPQPQQQPIDAPIPEVTGWQSVPMPDLEKPAVKSRSNSLRKGIAA